MASAYTYTTLKAAVVDTVEDDGSEFDAAFDNILALAEDKVLRELNLELFDTLTTTAFTAASPLLTKPTGMVAVRTIHYTDASNNQQLLLPKSWEFVKDYWPNAATTTASPKYYADYSETQWYIAGTPSGTNAVTVRAIVRPTGLSSTTTTTWLSQKVGDLLFYACLIGSEKFLKADERVATWKDDFNDRLALAKRELRVEERSDYMPMSQTPVKEPA